MDLSTVAETGANSSGDLVGPAGVERCVDAIRDLILAGELVPGQKVHQAELAARLRVSRVPIREALSRLSAEGLLDHRSNAGFTVARFTGNELSEIYLMRRLLETQLLRTCDLASIDVNLLEKLNDSLRSTIPRESSAAYQKLNLEFHFTVFAASPLEIVRQETTRLWNMSAYYRSLYLFVSEDTTHLCDEHARIIDAVRNRDVEALIHESDAHRSMTERIEVRLPRR